MDKKLEQSIEYFKTKFGNNCRILNNIGEFTHIFNLTLHPWKGIIKFQISDNKLDNVIMIASGFGDQHKWIFDQWNLSNNDLILFIEKIINEMPKPDDFDESDNIAKVNKKKKVHTSKIEKDKEPKKKLGMKTAEDVIKRILWDQELRPMDFSIGYLDRFIGIVEKNFSSFSWEDLASVDFTVLAIPKHRIQYFLYKGRKVWDKTNRLDNIFGSTGSGFTIRDIVTELENQPFHVAEKKEDNSNKLTKQTSDSDDDSEEDESDNVVINIDCGIVGMSQIKSNEVYFKMRPNYFLCQRITNSVIKNNYSKVQQKLLAKNHLYEQYFINPEMLHLTICTLGLYTEEQVDVVKNLLEDSQKELNRLVGNGIDFTVNGVGQFIDRVIYGKVDPSSKFMDFVNAVRLVLLEAGLTIKDNYEFVPHVTIMKIKYDRFRTAEIQTIPKEDYSELRDISFGSQIIDGIHLCSMTHERDSSGFYLTPAYISLPGIN